jgi:hypothetical protein
MTKTQTAPEVVKRGAGKPVASRRILAPDDKGDDDEIDRNRRQYENAHRRNRERSHSLSAGLHSNLVVPQLSSAMEGWAVPARSG